MAYENEQKMREGLREPFPPALIGHMPKGGINIAFVGHAAVTDRLNKVAPDWTYSIDKLFDRGNDCWIEGTITIGGVSRVEYGDGKTPKEAIGNFIRRGAMRFGVAIDLWSKEELEDAGSGNPSPQQPASPAQKAPVTPPSGASRSGGSGATAGGKSREDAPANKTPAPTRANPEGNPWQGMPGFE
jgi:hypothetical protein